MQIWLTGLSASVPPSLDSVLHPVIRVDLLYNRSGHPFAHIPLMDSRFSRDESRSSDRGLQSPERSILPYPWSHPPELSPSSLRTSHFGLLLWCLHAVHAIPQSLPTCNPVLGVLVPRGVLTACFLLCFRFCLELTCWVKPLLTILFIDHLSPALMRRPAFLLCFIFLPVTWSPSDMLIPILLIYLDR